MTCLSAGNRRRYSLLPILRSPRNELWTDPCNEDPMQATAPPQLPGNCVQSGQQQLQEQPLEHQQWRAAARHPASS